MAKDLDANPLHSKEESAFTTALLDHFEKQPPNAYKDQTVKDSVTLNVKIMESKVFEGIVRNEDALEIKNMLQKQKEDGNRFVSFQGEQIRLTRDDFTGHKTAFDALEHAHENTTDRDRYIVRSIPVVEKEVDNILENKKERSLDQKTGLEREGKRDQELSR